MRKLLLWSLSLVLLAGSMLAVLRPMMKSAAATPRVTAVEVPAAVFGRIQRLDPRFDALVPQDARLEQIVEDFSWVEGPVWNRREGYLLFTDIPNNSVHRWQPGAGVSLFLKPSGYSGSAPYAGREPGANGLAYDREGRLVLAEHGDRRVTRLEKKNRRTVLADRYQGRRLNSPNDVVFDSQGNLYFTDPPFGLPGTFDDPARELDFCGVYRLTPAGELSLLTRELLAPNGIALSPDEKTLYVTDVHPERLGWYAFALGADGSLGPMRRFAGAAEWARARPGGPDGLKTDAAGNLFASGPGGVYVFAPDGSLLGSIETGSATSNVAWGDDGRTLYITAGQAVYRIRLSTRGAGFGGPAQLSQASPPESFMKKSSSKATTAASTRKAAPAARKTPLRSRTRPAVNAEERERMIAEAAYYRAERRCFAAGDPADDWMQAAAEIDALLAAAPKRRIRQTG